MDNELPSLLNKGYVDNEYGLQFELGYYLRRGGYDVFFERNILQLDISSKEAPKKEIDIYAEKAGKKYAIELKYPLRKNSGGTAEIYHFVEDIQFAECLNASGIESYCITLTDSDEYTTRKTRANANSLWNGFRGICKGNSIQANTMLQGSITQTVKKKDGNNYIKQYDLKGAYSVVWKECGDRWYYILKAQ